MSTTTDTFTYWAAEMIDTLEDEKLEPSRWFARVNSVLVSINKPITFLYTAKSILQTPQNLTTWATQHGEEDVKNGITMILSHIQSHWRPSWYNTAGALRPLERPLSEILQSIWAPLAVEDLDEHSRSS